MEKEVEIGIHEERLEGASLSPFLSNFINIE